MLVWILLLQAIFGTLIAASPAPSKVALKRTPTMHIRGIEKRDSRTVAPTAWAAYLGTISGGGNWKDQLKQNFGIVAQPGIRALCPMEMSWIDYCVFTLPYPDPCQTEREWLEWCLFQRVMSCATPYSDMTVKCLTGTSTECISSLVSLQDCAIQIPVPTVNPYENDPDAPYAPL